MKQSLRGKREGKANKASKKTGQQLQSARGEAMEGVKRRGVGE